MYSSDNKMKIVLLRNTYVKFPALILAVIWRWMGHDFHLNFSMGEWHLQPQDSQTLTVSLDISKIITIS